MSEIITVTGTVEEIIYSNPDNGYSVVGIDSVEEGQFTATGYMPFITEGESVALSGNWTTHPDYGEPPPVYCKNARSHFNSVIATLSFIACAYLSALPTTVSMARIP